LLADVTAQLEELTALVGDLVELARDEGPVINEAVDVRLDEVVVSAVDRVRRRYPAVRFSTNVEPWLVVGSPTMLERCVTTVVSAISLAFGTAVTIGIIGMSQGFAAAKARALAPLSRVGSDIIVARVAGASTAPEPAAALPAAPTTTSSVPAEQTADADAAA